VQSLNGRYYTACDVGTFPADMDIVARESTFVTGRSVEFGGAGDSSILTALGVFQGMRAAAELQWGAATLAGKRVGVAGVGKVGRQLTDHLVADGASVVVTDVNPDAVRAVRAKHPQVSSVDDTQALITSDIDVYAPCALGGALSDETVAQLRAAVVAGGANNQLAHPGIEKLLAERGILYAPDYVVNAGGVIQVADEVGGFDMARARARAEKIFETTRQILRGAVADGIPPSVAADRLAERRMAGLAPEDDRP
jgi:valine dehydrogenase (NAD+)